MPGMLGIWSYFTVLLVIEEKVFNDSYNCYTMIIGIIGVYFDS